MNKQKLEQIVFAARKHARLRGVQAQRTRSGLAANGRRIVDDFPLELAVAPATVEDEETDERESDQHARRLAIVCGQIRDFVKTKTTYYALLARHLLGGEPVKSLASELGISPSAAKVTVHRARRYLGLVK